jgi:hypothetical protein
MGATNATWLLRGVTMEDNGSYDVIVTQNGRTQTSVAAEIVVTAVSRISNLSIRTNAGVGPDTLIVGFVVGGASSGPKPLLIRGAEPALRGSSA